LFICFCFITLNSYINFYCRSKSWERANHSITHKLVMKTHRHRLSLSSKAEDQHHSGNQPQALYLVVEDH
jgi:hypothetical protein